MILFFFRRLNFIIDKVTRVNVDTGFGPRTVRTRYIIVKIDVVLVSYVDRIVTKGETERLNFQSTHANSEWHTFRTLADS